MAGDAPGPRTATIPLSRLDADLARRCAALEWRVWPGGQNLETRVDHWRRPPDPDSERCADTRLHVAFSDADEVVAIARTLRRTISADGRRWEVLALAAVCSDPAQRGRGYARAVVLAAFARLGPPGPTTCFFQTGVPEFYERLGARRIANPIGTSVGKVAFWDPHPMVFPADAPWPAGPIDLLGSGW